MNFILYMISSARKFSFSSILFNKTRVFKVEFLKFVIYGMQLSLLQLLLFDFLHLLVKKSIRIQFFQIWEFIFILFMTHILGIIMLVLQLLVRRRFCFDLLEF
ncbi:hypothetical protein [Tundra vole stool-associated circular virus]|nr:hypothetical protein [Tundra vole stool-associated circular virus]